MKPKAATVVSAIEHATRHLKTRTLTTESPPLDPNKPWSMHCSAMFRETMRQLSSRGVKVSSSYTDENADANELGRRIMHSPGDWIAVPLHEVQALSNEGVVVVGVYLNPNGPGHMAIAYPTEMKNSSPLFRDGNIHRHHGGVTPSSYGAAPAEKAFYNVLGSTRFFKYRHTVP